MPGYRKAFKDIKALVQEVSAGKAERGAAGVTSAD
jgi:hypothetical protein